MKKILPLVIISLIALTACSKSVPVNSFSGVFPGLTCTDFSDYLKTKDLKYKKDGNKFLFELNEPRWKEAVIECNKAIDLMSFESTSSEKPVAAKAYIEAQQSLMTAFRNNVISYQEGNRVINFNNGVKLQQFSKPDKGTITHFIISVENTAEGKAAWEKVDPILTKISAVK